MFRSIEMVITNDKKEEALKFLKELNVLDFYYTRYSDTHIVFRIIIRKERTEKLLELFQKKFSSLEMFRITISPVDTYLPLPEEKNVNIKEFANLSKIHEERVSREEIYTKIREMSSLNMVYLLMVILSSFVAAIGVMNNNVAIIIAAMIIAPLLGPNIGLSFTLVMGDQSLVYKTLKTSAVGISIGFVVAVLLGMSTTVDPTIPSILVRTDVGRGGFLLALASGFAGALALTTELSSTLVGVMIGISLMPPLVTFGLLLGSGNYFLAWGALLIFVVNLVAIYLASSLTFYMQKIKPIEPEKIKIANKTSKMAITLFCFLFIILSIINQERSIIWINYIEHLPSMIP